MGSSHKESPQQLLHPCAFQVLQDLAKPWDLKGQENPPGPSASQRSIIEQCRQPFSVLVITFQVISVPVFVCFLLIMPKIISDFEQGLICGELRAGESVAAVAERFRHSRNTIRNVRSCVAATGGPTAHKVRKPSPSVSARRVIARKLALETKRLGSRVIPANPTSPAVRNALALRHDIKVHSRTVRRDLHAAGLRPFVRPKRPFDRSDERTVSKRLKFCQSVERQTKYVCKRPLCERLVFSDEHISSTNDHSSRIQWNVRRSSALPREQKARRNVVSVMLWAAIGHDFKSELRFIESTLDEETGKLKRMNARRYIDHCLARSGLMPFLKRSGCVFMQDGASCHTAKIVLKYLDDQRVNYITDWPPYSPDLNPIEQVWSHLERLRSESCPVATSVTELKAQLTRVWASIPHSVINAFVKSFVKKSGICAAAGGW